MFTLIEEDYKKTESQMTSTSEGDNVDAIKSVLQFISKSSELLTRWKTSLSTLATIKTISLISGTPGQNQ